MADTTQPTADSQWPRYEVFQQARPQAPFANVGSVHAPDPEIALQNARDVFVRRPETHRLWVVPAAEILSRTAEEIAQENWETPSHEEEASAGEKRYYIFRKTSQRRSMTFVMLSGEVLAASKEAALRLGLQRFGHDAQAFVWWIVPADAIIATRDEDVPSMFEPARDKSYRMPTEYHTQTLMREVQEKRRDS